MTEDEVLQTLREHFESLFPKVCPTCGRRFATLAEYIHVTTPIGPPTSFDAELGEWDTGHPIGSLVQANCTCHTTLALSTDGLPLPKRQAVLQWIKQETQRRGVSPSVLLARVREEVRRHVLGQANPEDPPLGGNAATANRGPRTSE
jgi:hypothetical protein